MTYEGARDTFTCRRTANPRAWISHHSGGPFLLHRMQSEEEEDEEEVSFNFPIGELLTSGSTRRDARGRRISLDDEFQIQISPKSHVYAGWIRGGAGSSSSSRLVDNLLLVGASAASTFVHVRADGELNSFRFSWFKSRQTHTKESTRELALTAGSMRGENSNTMCV